MSDYRVEMKNVHKSYGDNDVVKGVNLNVANNEVVVMIGARCGEKYRLAHDQRS